MGSDRATILAFDTSAAHCAAALLSGGHILAERREDMARGQAERLFPLLEEVLATVGLGWGDLHALGVGTGPGNFTGTRLSVSAARGLALGLGVPAIGVTGFEALAQAAGPRVLASLPAPRGEVYLQVLRDGAPDAAAWRGVPDAMPAPWPGSGLPCIGAAAAQIAAHTGGPALAAPDHLAGGIARVAAQRLGTAQPRPAPLYLRPADAAPPADPPPVILQ